MSYALTLISHRNNFGHHYNWLTYLYTISNSSKLSFVSHSRTYDFWLRCLLAFPNIFIASSFSCVNLTHKSYQRHFVWCFLFSKNSYCQDLSSTHVIKRRRHFKSCNANECTQTTKFLSPLSDTNLFTHNFEFI